MSTWIKADFDFGLPYTVFTVGVREAVKLGLVASVREVDPAVIERGILAFVEKLRPNLKGGSVVSLELKDGRRGWYIGYMHPALPRVSNQGWPEPERLMTCPTCGKGLPEVAWIGFTPGSDVFGHTTEYCNESCAVKAKSESRLTLWRFQTVPG